VHAPISVITGSKVVYIQSFLSPPEPRSMNTLEPSADGSMAFNRLVIPSYDSSPYVGDLHENTPRARWRLNLCRHSVTRVVHFFTDAINRH